MHEEIDFGFRIVGGYRRQYVSHEDNKMEQLQKMDSKVKLPGRVAGTVLGVTGALVMGAGMSLVMVPNNIKKGLALSIPGMIVALAAYPTYIECTLETFGMYNTDIK